MEKETRLQKKLERQSVRHIILWAAALLIVVVLFLTYGIQMLINFSLFLTKMKGGQTDVSSSTSPSYIASPMINPMPSATNSAEVIISGYSLPKYTVKLYVDGRLAASKEVNESKSFSFHSVRLREGDNDIKAKAITPEGKESEYSEPIRVTYQTKAPSLTVDTPQDGQTLSNDSNPLKVTGKTDAGANVKINDYMAIVDDEGKFSYLLPLQKGENHLKVIATDEAGNQTTKEIKVTLND
jgi:hypothetical protein